MHWTRTRQFARELPGVKNIINRETYLRKAIWILISIAISCLCFYQITENLVEYFEYPVTTRVDVLYDQNAAFPFVSICNLNILRSSKTNFLGPRLKNFWITGDKFASRQMAPRGTKRKTTDAMLMKDLLYFEMYSNRINTTNGYGHMPELMIYSCTYQGKGCDYLDFLLWQHPTFGNCLTLNSSSVVGKGTKASPGKDFGLELELYAEKEEYIHALTSSVGFQIEIHDGDSASVPDLNGFTISTGFATSVGVKRSDIIRQSKPYGNCSHGSAEQLQLYKKITDSLGRQESFRYTQRKCLRMCRWETFIKQCRCVNPLLATYGSVELQYGKHIEPCNPMNTTQRKCYDETMNGMNKCDVLCPQSCFDVQYTKSVTSSVWPSNEYIEAALPVWEADIPELRGIMNKATIPAEFNLSGPTLEIANDIVNMKKSQIIKENMAKVEVFFEELNYQIISERAKLTYIDLGVNFGGTMGLWIGMCVFNLFEVIEYLIDMICISVNKNKKPENEKSDDTLDDSYRVSPM